MSWIPLSKAATKYNLHPFAILSLIEKDDINGSLIGNSWFINENTLQEFIEEHFPLSESDRKFLRLEIKELEKQIDDEIQKDKQTLYILCSFDTCAPLFKDIIKDMSELIDDAQTRDIFYSVSTGISKEAIAQKWNICHKNISPLYNSAVKYIHEIWKTTEVCKSELQELTIQCNNYKSALDYQISEEEIPCMCHRIKKIPIEDSKLLLTSLEKLGIDIRIIRLLRKFNIYQLEDLLRFIKKNGFDALEKLPGVGSISCSRLLEQLIEFKIMEGKDSCYLFQYLIV